MTVCVGQVCPDGFLPVYSTDTEETARLLVTMACPTNLDSEHYARELINPLTGAPFTGRMRAVRFVAFGRRLEQLHLHKLNGRP